MTDRYVAIVSRHLPMIATKAPDVYVLFKCLNKLVMSLLLHRLVTIVVIKLFGSVVEHLRVDVL